MEPEPERMSDEELLSRTRELRERLLARLPGIRAMGVEVDAFLAECERFIEAKEGRSGEWVDSYEFMQRVSAFPRAQAALGHGCRGEVQLRQQKKASELLTQLRVEIEGTLNPKRRDLQGAADQAYTHRDPLNAVQRQAFGLQASRPLND